MGGLGSGRWTYSGRATVESLPRIGIAGLLDPVSKVPALRPLVEWTWTWSSNRGEMKQTATAKFEGDALRVSWERGPEAGCLVAVAWTACNFGGQRAWFECPSCHQRVTHLYLTSWRLGCRTCCDLTYASRREGRADRQMRRARALRGRVGGSADLVGQFPPKPPRMHWRTYERVRAAELRATNIVVASDRASLDRIIKRWGARPK